MTGLRDEDADVDADDGPAASEKRDGRVPDTDEDVDGCGSSAGANRGSGREADRVDNADVLIPELKALSSMPSNCRDMVMTRFSR